MDDPSINTLDSGSGDARSSVCSSACSDVSPVPGIVPILASDLEQLEQCERDSGAIHARRVRLVVDALTRCTANAQATIPSGRRGWDAETVGFRETCSEIAATLHLSELSAGNMIVHSEQLVTVFTSTLAALQEGRVSYWHTLKLVAEASSLPEEAHLAFEAAVLPFAETLTVSKFEQKARKLRERLHPESITVRHKEAFDDRTMWLTDEHDGMAVLCIRHKAVVLHAGANRIGSIAKSLAGHDEDRRQSQLQADVAVDLLLDGHTDPDDGGDLVVDASTVSAAADAGGATRAGVGAATGADGAERGTGTVVALVAAGPVFTDGADSEPVSEQVPLTAEELRFRGTACCARGIRPEVQVTVPAFILMGRDDLDPDGEVAVLEGYGPIDPETARELAAGAVSFRRILTHPETGAILSYGRDRYAVPADLRRVLRLRDGTCRFPGCNRQPTTCDIDHILDYQFDGETEHDNLAHLCARHHNLKHHTGWRYRYLVGGRLCWTGPSGREYTTEPENVLAIHSRRPSPSPVAAPSPVPVSRPTEVGEPPPF